MPLLKHRIPRLRPVQFCPQPGTVSAAFRGNRPGMGFTGSFADFRIKKKNLEPLIFFER